MEVEAPKVETVEQPTPVTEPVEAPKVEVAEAPSTEAAQYELPDGTKVDAEGLAKAWRDNFMPDYTRKAQENAAMRSKLEPKQEKPVEQSAPWENQDWQPKTYQELAEATLNQAEQRVWQKIMSEAERGEREAKERDAYIAQETEQLKALDPKVDVPKVMAYAAKYKFSSMIPAYQNMKVLEDSERRTEERVLKQMKLRASEPVGASSAQVGANVSFPSDVKTGLEKARWLIRNNKV